MPREMIKKAGSAAATSALRAIMAWFDENLKAIREDIRGLREEMHNEIRALDAKVDGLREEMLDRFERQLATINEVAHRVTRVEGKLEGYMEALRLSIIPPSTTRKRKAG